MGDGRAALAANLKRLRAERGLSQKDLAAKAGIPYRPIQLAESGDSGMNADTLVAVAKYLNMTVDELVREKPSPPAAERNRTRLDLIALILAADDAKITQLASILDAELPGTGSQRAGGED